MPPMNRLSRSASELDRLMAVNLKGMFLFGQACAREMIKQNQAAARSGATEKPGGALLFTASVNGLAAKQG